MTEQEENPSGGWLDLGLYDDIYDGAEGSLRKDGEVGEEEDVDVEEEDGDARAEDEEDYAADEDYDPDRGHEILLLVLGIAETALFGLVCAVPLAVALAYLLFGGRWLRRAAIALLFAMPFADVVFSI